MLARSLAVVTLFSPALPAQEVIHRSEGESTFANYGEAIASIGDCTGDGLPDWVVAGSDHILPGPTGTERGVVVVRSGLDGSQVLRLTCVCSLPWQSTDRRGTCLHSVSGRQDSSTLAPCMHVHHV